MTPDMESSQDVYEPFQFGIRRRYLDNDNLLEVKTDGNMSRLALDMWFNVIKESVDRWPDEKPVFFLCDVSHKNQGMTPYARAKTQELYRYFAPPKVAYVAVILPPTIIFKIMTLFIHQYRQKNVHVQLYVNREEGLNWLRQRMTGINSNGRSATG